MTETKVWPRVPSGDAIIEALFNDEFGTMVWHRESFERFIKLGRKLAKDYPEGKMEKLIYECRGLRDMVRDIADTMFRRSRGTVEYSSAVASATRQIYAEAKRMILQPAETVL